MLLRQLQSQTSSLAASAPPAAGNSEVQAGDRLSTCMNEDKTLLSRQIAHPHVGLEG